LEKSLELEEQKDVVIKATEIPRINDELPYEQAIYTIEDDDEHNPNYMHIDLSNNQKQEIRTRRGIFIFIFNIYIYIYIEILLLEIEGEEFNIVFPEFLTFIFKFLISIFYFLGDGTLIMEDFFQESLRRNWRPEGYYLIQLETCIKCMLIMKNLQFLKLRL
jgi:hypothetical protein